MLQSSLIDLLGEHITQAGSKVEEDKIRFDFTHFQALDESEIETIEGFVNEWILDDFEVCTKEMGIEEAKASGAKALFGEKYGDMVRVVSIPGFWTGADRGAWSELCGGTHVKRTSEIGSFKILSESSVSAGVRRIEAVVGNRAIEYYREQSGIVSKIRTVFKCSENAILDKIEDMRQKIKALENEVKTANLNAARGGAEKIMSALKNGKVNFAVENLGEVSKEIFTATHDSISEIITSRNLTNVAVCLIAEVAGAVMIATSADKTANANGILCGDLVKKAAAIVGGGGGGSPLKAQAGGKNPAKIGEAVKELENLLG
jgi:alanyl-tRNA synthetase